MRHLAGGEVREIGLRQGLQREARAAGAEQHLAGVAGRLERDLRARRAACARCRRAMWAGTVVAPGCATSAGERLDHLEVEIGRLQRSAALVGAQQHVRQDRDGVAPLDDAMDMAQGLQQGGPFDRDLHGSDPSGAMAPNGECAAAGRGPAPGRQNGRSPEAAKSAAGRPECFTGEGRPAHGRAAGQARTPAAGRRTAAPGAQSSSMRLRRSTSSCSVRSSPIARRSCARRAAPWCGRGRRSAGRSRAGSAGSAPWRDTWRSGAASPRSPCGAPR